MLSGNSLIKAFHDAVLAAQNPPARAPAPAADPRMQAGNSMMQWLALSGAQGFGPMDPGSISAPSAGPKAIDAPAGRGSPGRASIAAPKAEATEVTLGSGDRRVLARGGGSDGSGSVMIGDQTSKDGGVTNRAGSVQVKDGNAAIGAHKSTIAANGDTRSSSAHLGTQGISAATQVERDDKKRSIGMVAGKDGFGLNGGLEGPKGGINGSVMVGDGTFGGGATLKSKGGWEVGGSAHTVDKVAGGASNNPLAAGFGVTHTTGSGWGVNGGFDGSWGGFGVSGAAADRRQVGFQRSEERIKAEFDPAKGGMPWATWDAVQSVPHLRDAYLKGRYGDRVEGVDSFADAKLGGMAVGDGWTFLDHAQSEAALDGRFTALSAGFGDKNLDATQTSIARTERGWSIRMETSTSDADLAKVGIGGAVGMGTEETKASGHAVQFDVEDSEAGRAQLERFSKTGLLPGAEKLADPSDPDRYTVDALTTILAMEGIPGMDPSVIADTRRQLNEVVGRLNARVLGASGGQVLDMAPAGVDYTAHTESRSESEKLSLSAFGLELLNRGSTQRWWEHDYKEDGKRERELGYGRDEDYWFAPDEKTAVSVNPEGPGVRQHGVELALTSLQSTTKDQRQLIDRVGATGMDPNMRSAWAKGQVKDGDRAQTSLALTGKQLDTIRDRLGPKGDDFAQLRADARNGLQDFGLAPLQSATSKELGKMGGSGPSAMFVAHDRAGDLISKVTSAEAFDALSYDDKRRFLTFSSQGAQYRDEWKKDTGREAANPWRALPLALREPDPEKRNELVRSMFEAIEGSSLDSTTGVLQLVSFLEQDGKAAGMSDDERKELLQGFSARVLDGRVEDRARLLAKDPASAQAAVANGLLADSHLPLTYGDRRFSEPVGGGYTSSLEAHRGDAMVDWLLAADRSGDTAMLSGALGQAVARDPQVVQRILDNTRHEPWRHETAKNLLRKAGVLK